GHSEEIVYQSRHHCALIRLHTHTLVLIIALSEPVCSQLCTLSLHDALPISAALGLECGPFHLEVFVAGDKVLPIECGARGGGGQDRKSTRLNSSHVSISYAVFCLKKKNEEIHSPQTVHNSELRRQSWVRTVL